MTNLASAPYSKSRVDYALFPYIAIQLVDIVQYYYIIFKELFTLINLRAHVVKALKNNVA